MRAEKAVRILKQVLLGLLLTVTGLFMVLPRSEPHVRPKRIKVRLWHLLDGQWQAAVEKVVDRFNKSQDKYEVVPLLLPGDDSANSKFLLSVAGGDPPDVMLHWTQAMSTWAEAGVLRPLDTLMTPEERQRFEESYPVIRKNGWYKGHLYGITEGFDLWVCYYRPDLLKAAGIDPDHFPNTLEDLVALGHKMDHYDSSGNLTRVGFLPSGLNNYVSSFGGGYYDEQTGKVTLNTPQNLRALQFLVDERKRLGFDKVLRFNAGLKTDSGASWPFISGEYGVALDGEWRVQQMAQFAPSLKYKVALLPPPAGGRPLASFSEINYLTIPKGAREPEGAWEFIKFWTGLEQPERAAEFYPWLSWLPMSPRMGRAPAYEAFLQKAPQYRTFLKLAESDNIVTTPPVPYQLYLRDRITQTEDLATRGTLTPEKALIQLEKDIAKERSRRKELGYAD